LTAYLIVASRNGTQDTPLPKDLASPIAQMSSAFPYKAFTLLDAIDMRLTSGAGGTLKGILPQTRDAFPNGGHYSIVVSRVTVFGQAQTVATLAASDVLAPANLIQFANLNLTVNEVNFATDVDVKEGQKVVVGKANIDGSADALIVILTAKVVE
jgi:hypothetical protein